jgi:hypothetical protein
VQLKNAHAENAQVQARLFATYRREYENFTHLPGESIDAMFQRSTVIVNNMRANVAVLPYDDHDRAVKLLHSLDRTVWSGKVEAILESEKYETLTVDELFSKLKSSEVDRVSYGPPWAHYLGGYQDRLLGGPLGLHGLRYTAPEGVEHKDYTGVVLG